jgi:hypothetical protein
MMRLTVISVILGLLLIGSHIQCQTAYSLTEAEKARIRQEEQERTRVRQEQKNTLEACKAECKKLFGKIGPMTWCLASEGVSKKLLGVKSFSTAKAAIYLPSC